MHCENCGSEIKAGHKFCESCGSKASEVSGTGKSFNFKPVLIGLILLLVIGGTFAYFGSFFKIKGETPKVVCKPPYILVGADCCLDKDSNSICDKDEITKEIAIEQKFENENQTKTQMNKTEEPTLKLKPACGNDNCETNEFCYNCYQDCGICDSLIDIYPRLEWDVVSKLGDKYVIDTNEGKMLYESTGSGTPWIRLNYDLRSIFVSVNVTNVTSYFKCYDVNNNEVLNEIKKSYFGAVYSKSECFCPEGIDCKTISGNYQTLTFLKATDSVNTQIYTQCFVGIEYAEVYSLPFELVCEYGIRYKNSQVGKNITLSFK